jgi:hypothetical protein
MNRTKLGTVNPTYMEDGNQEDHGYRRVQAKSSKDPILTNKKLGMVVHTCHHSYRESTNRKITVQAWPNHKHETLFKK